MHFAWPRHGDSIHYEAYRSPYGYECEPPDFYQHASLDHVAKDRLCPSSSAYHAHGAHEDRVAVTNHHSLGYSVFSTAKDGHRRFSDRSPDIVRPRSASPLSPRNSLPLQLEDRIATMATKIREHLAVDLAVEGSNGQTKLHHQLNGARPAGGYSSKSRETSPWRYEMEFPDATPQRVPMPPTPFTGKSPYNLAPPPSAPEMTSPRSGSRHSSPYADRTSHHSDAEDIPHCSVSTSGDPPQYETRATSPSWLWSPPHKHKPHPRTRLRTDPGYSHALAREQEEARECTFTPNISEYAKQLSHTRPSQQDTFMRLHLEQMAIEARKEQQRNHKEHRHHPVINRNAGSVYATRAHSTYQSSSQMRASSPPQRQASAQSKAAAHRSTSRPESRPKSRPRPPRQASPSAWDARAPNPSGARNGTTKSGQAQNGAAKAKATRSTSAKRGPPTAAAPTHSAKAKGRTGRTDTRTAAATAEEEKERKKKMDPFDAMLLFDPEEHPMVTGGDRHPGNGSLVSQASSHRFSGRNTWTGSECDYDDYDLCSKPTSPRQTRPPIVPALNLGWA